MRPDPQLDNDMPNDVGVECPISGAFDPFSAEYQADPAAAQAEPGRVYFSEVLGWYVVQRHEDIRQVASDTECFSSSNFASPMTPLCPAAQAKLDEYGYTRTRPVGSLDEPLHLTMRRAIEEPFKQENIAAMEPWIREVWSGYVGRFANDGRADLIAQFVAEAPARVAIEFMGVPGWDVETLKRSSAQLVSFIFGRPTEEEQVATCELIAKQYLAAKEMVDRIKADPTGPGLLPYAVRLALDRPAQFDDQFLISLCINTLTASHETTSSSLANILLELLRDRVRWEAVCDEPHLIRTAVEEGLRAAPSRTTSRRLCVRDTVVGGVRIPAGGKVLLGVAAANRDEDIFTDADTFDVARRNAKRHLTFGYGGHFCLGAPLARLQMRVAIEELTSRLPHLTLVPGQIFDFPPNVSARSPKMLFVEWGCSGKSAASPTPLVPRGT